MKQLIAILYGQSHNVTLAEVITAMILSLKASLSPIREFIQTNKKAIAEVVGTFLTFIMMVALTLAFIYLFN